MPVTGSILSQYHAALTMLGEAISKCPASLWDDRACKNTYWHIAYHTLFYTHLYLQQSEQTFVPWHKHRNGYQFLGRPPRPPYEVPKIGTPYTKADLLAYFEVCQNEVEKQVPLLDLETDSGFEWLPFSKLELQFYNIRHIQHHTGQLTDRLRTEAGIGIDWVRLGTA